jgi:hypothetical protein
MKKIDLKQRMREVQFTTEHSLNKDQLIQLIREKLERAERFARFDKVQEERTLQP